MLDTLIYSGKIILVTIGLFASAAIAGMIIDAVLKFTKK